MRVKPLRPFDMTFFPVPMLEGSTGLTLWRDDGTPAMCGGIAPCPWGQELWVEVRCNVTRGERIKIGRIAKSYVQVMLDHYGELYAHARRGNERWLSWLGMELQQVLIDNNGEEARKWRITKEAAWASE